MCMSVYVYVCMYTYLHGGYAYLRTERSIKRQNERIDLVQFRNYVPEYMHLTDLDMQCCHLLYNIRVNKFY